MYANDVIIYCRATEEEVATIGSILHQYCDWTGQAINWSKSSIHFSRNVPNKLRGNLCRHLGMKECNHMGKYLGNKFCNFHNRKADYKAIME